MLRDEHRKVQLCCRTALVPVAGLRPVTPLSGGFNARLSCSPPLFSPLIERFPDEDRSPDLPSALGEEA